MRRRTVLAGAAASAAGFVSGAAFAADTPAASPVSPDLATALARFRASIPARFDQTYVENAVIPFFLTSIYEGERPALPMIDATPTKENALPHDLWGLIYQDWKPSPEEGVTVFLQGLEKRGDNNLRKRIYMSAVTPDLYRPMYGDKVVAFFDGLLDPKFSGRPFMRHYLDYYWDIYWDLHLGVKGEAIPPQVRTIGESFNTVLAFRDPTQPIVYDNYMTVRALLQSLKTWIDERLDDIANARIANPKKTIAWYWLKNAGDGTHFSKKDVVFECFHNFVAFSQWGNTIFGIMSRLNQDGGDPAVRAAFAKTMSGNPDAANGAPYTPLEMFVRSYSAQSRRMAEAFPRSWIRGRRVRATTMATAYPPLSGSGCLTSGAATSYPRTPRPASIPGTGPILSNSTRIVTVTCRPALRWTRQGASRLASPNAHSTSRR